MKMKTIPTITLIALTMILGSTRARGSLIEFTFGGQLSEFAGTPTPPWESAGIGSEFLVTYVFDTETPDLDLNTFNGRYAVESLSVSIDGVAQFASWAEIVIRTVDPSIDRYIVQFGGPMDGFVGNISLIGFSVLTSDDLLLDINLDEWFIPFFEAGTGISAFSATITTFSSQIVPVPSVFLPAGLLGILFLHGRRRPPDEGIEASRQRGIKEQSRQGTEEMRP